MALKTIDLLLGAIEAAAKVWYEYKVTAVKTRDEACKKAAREYMQVDHREDTYKGITDKRAIQLKTHFRKRFENLY